MSGHPFGMTPYPSQVLTATASTQEVYAPLPETTCDHRAQCCNAGCPNMYYAEFLGIYHGFVEQMPQDQWIELTLQCLRMYLQPQKVDKPKPCPLLKDSKCSVYFARPLRCRLYGLYPSALYKQMVEGVAKDMGVPEESVPLCKQCDRVKIKPMYAKDFPLGKVPTRMIDAMVHALRDIDLKLGVPKNIQQSGFGYLTYHDWHIMYVLGEGFMEHLSVARTTWTDEKKELLIQDMKKSLTSAKTDDENDKREA